MTVFKRIRALISDSSRSINERMYIFLTIIAMAISAMALVGDIIYNDSVVDIISLAATLVVLPLAAYIGIRFDKLGIVIRIVSLLIILVIVPLAFLFGGGVEGVAIPWLVFCFLYIGLVLSGWWRRSSLVILVLVILLLFTLSYYHPEWLAERDRAVLYIDVALSVIEVGAICFIMTWFQNRLFMAENERAREETKRVEDLNRSQNRFFSNMSHEIRTPINSILGLNEIILRQDDASDEIIKDAGNIQGAGRMLLALINDILDFSKIEAGKMDIVPVNYNIASLISEIANMIWMRAEQKGLDFNIEIDPSIPAELFGDEIRIKQILVNLINNAVKYTNEGSVTLHVEKEDTQGDQVVLTFSVIDTGIGIKQDAIPHLFDAFQRMDEEKNSKIEGTGLGLSIVKSLVDLMGGRITVNSVYTQGSTFIVTLRQKVTRADAVGEINITGSAGTGRKEKYLAGFKAPDVSILIVDDNAMNLEVEKKLLEGTEITVDTAQSGEEALAATLGKRYDIILMDHLMPVMDGIECMQFIRKQVGGLNNRVPIIALTANAGSENRELYSRSGFEDYLVKPVMGRQLEDMIIAHLPESKIQRIEGSDPSRLRMNTSSGYSQRIPVLVATGSMCDLPGYVLKKYQIDIIPFIVKTGGKIYYDGLETETDEVIRYMEEGVEFDSDAPSVEDFEQFFGRSLKKAHNVIYISIASGVSPEYERARAAARAYENVRVFDSGTNSSAVGLMVLLAHSMSLRGETPDRIMEELRGARNNICFKFVTSGTNSMRRMSHTDKIVANFMQMMSIKPYFQYRNSQYRIDRLAAGEAEGTYQRFIEHALPLYTSPDLELLIVVYSGIEEKYFEPIEADIRKRFDFKKIIFQKASSVMALNLGTGAFGFVYNENGSRPYNLAPMFSTNEEALEFEDNILRDAQVSLPGVEKENTEEAAKPLLFTERIKKFAEEIFIPQEAPQEENTEAEEESDRKWYEKLEGIDHEEALKYCGTEDVLRTAMETFYDSIDEKADELDDLLNTDDIKNYTIKVHALKTTALLVGAGKLASDALNLEMAGKREDADYIHNNHAETMKEFRAYRDILGVLFEAKADDSIVDSLYESLREGALMKDDEVIEESFDEVKGYSFDTGNREIIDRLRDSFDRRDYEEMISVIDGRKDR